MKSVNAFVARRRLRGRLTDAYDFFGMNLSANAAQRSRTREQQIVEVFFGRHRRKGFRFDRRALKESKASGDFSIFRLQFSKNDTVQRLSRIFRAP